MKLYKKQVRPMIVNGGIQGCATTKTPLLPEQIWFDEEIVTDADKLAWEKTIKNKDAYASLSMECRYSEVEDIKKETEPSEKMNDYKAFCQNEVSDFIKQELAKQNEPLRMDYIGYSSHDCESWYECPKCKAHYGSWSFINGAVTVTDGKFKCHECGTILYVPK